MVETPRLSPVASLGTRAAADLSFIRSAMERSGRFTAVPGWSGVFLGALAVAAGGFCVGSTTERWPEVWLVAAALAVPVNAWSMQRKARRQGFSVLRGRGRSFLFGLCPPLIAGAVMTGVLWHSERVDLLPQTWLLLYGTAVVTGGTRSLPVVTIMGVAFMILGVLSSMAPASWGQGFLMVGFGGLHLSFGAWIGLRHGG